MKKIMIILILMISNVYAEENIDKDPARAKIFLGYNAGSLVSSSVSLEGNKENLTNFQYYRSFVFGARNDYLRGFIESSPARNYAIGNGNSIEMSQTLVSFDYLAPVKRKLNYDTKISMGVVTGTNSIYSGVNQLNGTVLGVQVGLLQELNHIDLNAQVRYLGQISSSGNFDSDYESWQLLLGLSYSF